MGLLTGELTTQDIELSTTQTTKAKAYKPSLGVDIGKSIIYGAEKGAFNLVNAADRIINQDDEGADKRLDKINKQIKPTNQGTAGQITAGLTEVVTTGALAAPTGTVGVGLALGLGTRAAEHSKLTQEYGVDQDTADTAANIFGVTNAVLGSLPMSNVFKQPLRDYALTVGGSTVVGQALTYGEGMVLEDNGYGAVGKQYKESATDPSSILLNVGVGSVFWALGRVRADPNATQADIAKAEAKAYDAVDQAISDADKGSIPTKPDSVGDLMQHEANINKAIDQVMKGEKVSISEATGGQLKTLQDMKDYIKSDAYKNKESSARNTTIETTTSNPSTSLESATTSSSNFVKNNVLKALPIKSDEAIAGGQVRGYTADFAHAANSTFGSNIKYFSSFNDDYHKGTGSKHSKGQAFDIVLKDPSKASQTIAELNRIAKEQGFQIKLLDEYAKPSKNSTGGHIHVSVTGRSGVTTGNAKAFTGSGTAKSIYDEAVKGGLSDADARFVVGLAHFETGGTFSPTVQNKKSGATGVFQFIDSTWRQEGGTSTNRHDLGAQVRLGIQHTKANIKYVQDQTGVTLTGSQIYLPHLLGRGGAVYVMKEIRDTPNKLARDVLTPIYGSKTDAVMKNNGIKEGSSIQDAMRSFTKRIDDITAQHYGAGKSFETQRVADDLESTVVKQDEDLSRPYQDFPEDPHSSMMDSLPDLDNGFIHQNDLDAFNAKHTYDDDPFGDLFTHSHEDAEFIPAEPIVISRVDDAVYKELDDFLEGLQVNIDRAPIPHTAKGVKVKDNEASPAREFKPDENVTGEWKTTKRFENNKYHDQQTRSYKDKDGNTVQELKYKDSYVRRTVDDSHKTNSIHVGRFGKSDFVDHKGNKELETALDRAFEERAYGYLSQVPKGQETITRLEANPDTIISTKGIEDLTAAQWKQKLQREQDNIQMLSKAMKTLASCALKQAA